MIHRQLFLLYSLAILLNSVTWAQAVIVDEQLDRWLSGERVNPELWKVEGKWWLENAERTGNCDSLLVGYGLVLAAKNYGLEVELPEIDCPKAGFYISYNEGQKSFDAAEYTQAISWYDQSLSNARTPRQIVDAKFNIGMCHYWSDDFEQALEWFVSATNEGMEWQSSNSLNTLASVCMALQDYEQSLAYSSAAEEKLIEEFKAGLDKESFVMFHDLILMNMAAAHLELGQFSQTRKAFERATMQSFLPGMAPEFVHLAFILAWEFDDPAILEMHAETFGQALMEDSAGAVARMGPVLALLPPWRNAAGASLNSLWDQIKNLPPSDLPDLPDPTSSDRPSVARFHFHPFLVWLVLLWFVSGCLVVFLALWKSRQQRKSPFDLRNLGALLNEVSTSDEVSAEIQEEALRGIRELEAKWGARLSEVPIRDFTSRELEVFRAAIVGERPKELAQRLGLAVNTVYTLRTAIRTKLDIPKEVELESWIQQNWRQ